MREVQIAVVGAGPAGLAASAEASKAGARVLVIDQSPQPGGQYFKQLPPEYSGNGRPDWEGDESKGKALLQAIRSNSIEVLLDTTVLEVQPDKTLVLACEDHFFRVKPEKLILATGAFERPVPFPGWTLPGVFSAGALQALVKIQRVLPGRRILVAGSGPLLLLTASMLVDAGAEVCAVLEASRWTSGWRESPKLFRHLPALRSGLKYMINLNRAGVPILSRHTIVRAEGDQQVRQAVIARVDTDWKPIKGTEREYRVDAVCVSFGFLPSIELAQLAGCQLEYNSRLAAFSPTHDQYLESSVPGLFVAGEIAGIAGASVAMAQGAIAGLMAAKQLGFVRPSFEARLVAAKAELARLNKFRQGLDSKYEMRPGIWTLMEDDTIVCRCNEVTAGQLRRAAEESALDEREVKLRTSAGMGPCQSRFCGDSIRQMISRVHGVRVDQIPLPRTRPPARPVPLAALLEETQV